MLAKKKQEVKHDILIDKSTTGRIRPWADKKQKNLLLAKAYDDFNFKKAVRLRKCASHAKFKKYPSGAHRLLEARFCRCSLCPMCIWRKGLKIFSQTNAIMDAANETREYAYIFVTLTVRNVMPEELGITVDRMMKAWNRFANYKKVKSNVKGWYRGLEITHNVDHKSSSYDTFHPHFHCIFAVNKSYFTDRSYVSQKDWTSLWQKAMQISYTPIVDVRKVKGNTAKAVAEVAKYAVKDADYILPDDWEMTIDTVKLLDAVLHKRRLVAFGGVFKDLHKQLNLDDVNDENTDLIHVEEEQTPEEAGATEVMYAFNIAYGQYLQIE